MKLDLEKWNTVRKDMEEQIKALKHAIRKEDKDAMEYKCTGVENGMRVYGWVKTGRTYRGGSWEEYRDLKELKEKSTALYCLRAALRNREHIPGMDRDEALALLPEYEIAEKAA